MRLGLENNVISATGWNAFSQLLWDISSINKTYCSNQILYNLRSVSSASNLQGWNVNEELATLLCINEHCDTRQAAAIKILLNHPDLNMQPESCHTCWAGCVHAERLSWLENCRDNE